MLSLRAAEMSLRRSGTHYDQGISCHAGHEGCVGRSENATLLSSAAASQYRHDPMADVYSVKHVLYLQLESKLFIKRNTQDC